MQQEPLAVNQKLPWGAAGHPSCQAPWWACDSGGAGQPAGRV